MRLTTESKSKYTTESWKRIQAGVPSSPFTCQPLTPTSRNGLEHTSETCVPRKEHLLMSRRQQKFPWEILNVSNKEACIKILDNSDTYYGMVVNGVWQQWDVDAGQFWSSRSVTCSNGSVSAGFGGAPFYTLSQIQTMCPEAIVVGFGVNIGSNNPSYDVETDLVSFNNDVFNFEPTLTPTTRESCKNGGWMGFNSPVFRNQGECVAYVNFVNLH
jgi:hypothetical protein